MIFQKETEAPECKKEHQVFPLGSPRNSSAFLELKNQHTNLRHWAILAIFSEALLTEQVSSGEGGWPVVEREDGVPSPFLQSLVSYLVLSLRRSHQSCFLGTCCLSSTSLLLAMPKRVGLNECTMPTTPSNSWAGRHDGSLAKRAVCLQCCCWPLSSPWSLFRAVVCRTHSPAQLLQGLYGQLIPLLSASTSRKDSLHLHFTPETGISWRRMTKDEKTSTLDVPVEP